MKTSAKTALVFAALTVFFAALRIGLAMQAPAPAPGQTGQTPAVGAAPQTQAPTGQRRGRGGGGARGAPAVDQLGAGPWDFDTERGRIRVSVVTKGLDHPWGLVFLPDGGMLVTERPGRLRAIRNGQLDPTPISGLPQIRAASLGGLLDIALHPNFAQNRWIYFAYSKPGAEEPARATLAVGRARWDGGSELSNVTDILVADGYHGGRGAPRSCCGQGPADGSYGSRLAFDRAGFLYDSPTGKATC